MCRVSIVRRSFPLGLVVATGLVVSACGASASGAGQAAPVTTARPITTTTTLPRVDPTCSQSAATSGCRLEPTAIVVWTQVQSAQTQAAQLQVAEQQYATCFTYARLDLPANAPLRPTCSTTGLTSAEVLQIQALIMET
jgi:hypothetical protein